MSEPLDTLQAAVDALASGWRRLWQAIAIILGFFGILYGVTYALQGNVYAVNPALTVLKRVPGGMHTHGVIMLILGVGLILEAMMLDWTWSRWVTRVYSGYSVVVTITIFGSWWITGKPAVSPIWFWLAFAAIAGALIHFPPPPKPNHGKGVRANRNSRRSPTRSR